MSKEKKNFCANFLTIPSPAGTISVGTSSTEQNVYPYELTSSSTDATNLNSSDPYEKLQFVLSHQQVSQTELIIYEGGEESNCCEMKLITSGRW